MANNSNRTGFVRDRLQVRPDRGLVHLPAMDPSETHGVKRRQAKEQLRDNEEHMMSLQDRLFAEGRRSVLVVLQGMDTCGKDGTVRHAFRGLNPQGVRVVSFKAPTPAEQRHDFLWRIRRQVPQPGEIVIFNRSHYEDVLVASVMSLVPATVIEERYALINEFEAELVKAGVTLVKACLHISEDEQRDRLLARLRDPDKHWKFSSNDLAARGSWDQYQAAYSAALAHCSTAEAPWYVVPANHKWYRDWAMARILIEAMTDMNPMYPQPALDVPALKKRLKQEA